MTQEDKELLLKDISARLPYGVKMNHVADKSVCPSTLIGVTKDMITLQGEGGCSTANVEEYKPYLFPISTMTKKQEKQYADILVLCDTIGYSQLMGMGIILEDWFHGNHIDIRGLIPRGLAIDATDKNIY